MHSQFRRSMSLPTRADTDGFGSDTLTGIAVRLGGESWSFPWDFHPWLPAYRELALAPSTLTSRATDRLAAFLGMLHLETHSQATCGTRSKPELPRAWLSRLRSHDFAILVLLSEFAPRRRRIGHGIVTRW